MARRDDDEDLAGDGGNGRGIRRDDNERRFSDTARGGADNELRVFIERIERLEEEKKTIGDDIKDVYGEAKGRGYDTKAMKKIVAMRKKDANERYEEETVLDTYLAALGMAPLGGTLD